MSEARSIPRIGGPAPDFTAVATQDPGMRFSEWQGKSWAVLFSHPADFTPVRTTELTAFARQGDEFEKRNVKLIGLSVDSVHAHLAWIENMREKPGVETPYPLNVGRNVDEVLRLVTALQTADQHACSNPVDWRPGQKVVVPPPKGVPEIRERLSHRGRDYDVKDFYLSFREGPPN